MLVIRSQIIYKKKVLYLYLYILIIFRGANQKWSKEIMKYYLYKFVDDRKCLLIPSKFDVSLWSNIVKTGAFQIQTYNRICCFECQPKKMLPKERMLSGPPQLFNSRRKKKMFIAVKL